MRRLNLALAAALAVALAGCLDLDEEYSINPDGSGKVVVKCVMAPMRFQVGAKKSPEESLKADVRETLEKSAGVDAWSDVTVALQDDGKVAFRGTAYFKDYSALKLRILGVSSTISELTITKNADGSMKAVVKPLARDEAAAEPVKLTEEQIQTRMKEERAKYTQARPMIETFFKDAKVATRLHLPGALGEVRAFKKLDANSVELKVEGGKLIGTLDQLMKDDAFLRRSVESGRDIDKSGPPMDDSIVEKIFGEKGPIQASTKGPLKPLFDYEAEAAKARAGMAELEAKFGAAAAAVAPPAGAGFKSVRIAGVQWVHGGDEERGVSPFGKSSPSLVLSIVAELGGSALTAKEGSLKVASADDGQSLLPKEDFEREIHFPKLSNDRSAITFEVSLGLPGPKAAGLKEVSGTLRYLVADKTVDANLGISEFRKGAKGSAHGAEIEKIEESQFEKGDTELGLKLLLSPDAVESIEFYDAAGKKLPATRQGYSSSGDECTLDFHIKGALPPKGKIVAKIYDAPKMFDAPWKITNVDLLGRAKQ